jgi:hypothetical protein
MYSYAVPNSAGVHKTLKRLMNALVEHGLTTYLTSLCKQDGYKTAYVQISEKKNPGVFKF